MANQCIHYVWVEGDPAAVSRAKALVNADFLLASELSIEPLPASGAGLLRYRYATERGGPATGPLAQLTEAVEGLRVTLVYFCEMHNYHGFEVFAGGSSQGSDYERLEEQEGSLPDHYPYVSQLRAEWAAESASRRRAAAAAPRGVPEREPTETAGSAGGGVAWDEIRIDFSDEEGSAAGGFSPSPALDNLACSVTTMRDASGLVRPQALAGLTRQEREFLAGTDQYRRDEMFPEEHAGPAGERVEGLLRVVRDGRIDGINGALVARTSGTEWRHLVEGGSPVREVLAAVAYDGLCNFLWALAPHLRHALECHPEAIADAADRAVRELSER